MNRRELREHIFRLLFCMEFHEPEALEEQITMYIEALSEPKQKEIDYMTRKTEKIYKERESLDEKINAVTTGRKTDRMAKTDLILIRTALYEMDEDEDVPTGVAINEAVELAKRYGTKDSASFVNGVLARLA